mmetsp:Transcript_6943/g.12354  ORF Transcript_6943/g.12354 Transcript_6943/m.12354 type:complete len:593 (-) Transcript_6943:25-1803(-)
MRGGGGGAHRGHAQHQRDQPLNETFDAGTFLLQAADAVRRAFVPGTFSQSPRSLPDKPVMRGSSSFTAGQQLPRFWEVRITQLLDLPHSQKQLGGFWGHPNEFVVRAEDDRQRVLATSPVIPGSDTGGKTATITLGDEGCLRLEATVERVLLTVERSDGHIIGHCPVSLTDPRNAQPFAYTLLDERGKSVNCGIELKVRQRSNDSMYHKSEYGRLGNPAEAPSFFTAAASLGFQTNAPSSSSRQQQSSSRNIQQQGGRGGFQGLLVVSVESARELASADRHAHEHYFCATAHYPDEPKEKMDMRKSAPMRSSHSSTNSSLQNCAMRTRITLPHQPRQQYVLVTILEVGPHSDDFIGQAALLLTDRRLATMGSWPVKRDGRTVGCINLKVELPDGRSSSGPYDSFPQEPLPPHPKHLDQGAVAPPPAPAKPQASPGRRPQTSPAPSPVRASPDASFRGKPRPSSDTFDISHTAPAQMNSHHRSSHHRSSSGQGQRRTANMAAGNVRQTYPGNAQVAGQMPRSPYAPKTGAAFSPDTNAARRSPSPAAAGYPAATWASPSHHRVASPPSPQQGNPYATCGGRANVGTLHATWGR